jgi:hypothetical protein
VPTTARQRSKVINSPGSLQPFLADRQQRLCHAVALLLPFCTISLGQQDRHLAEMPSEHCKDCWLLFFRQANRFKKQGCLVLYTLPKQAKKPLQLAVFDLVRFERCLNFQSLKIRYLGIVLCAPGAPLEIGVCLKAHNSLRRVRRVVRVKPIVPV